jgi:two-component system chemotaxis sensor kinase CheA
MLPLSTVFEPSARMVRQVARDLGKQVDYRASGGEIELDRQIIDRLGDALLHLLRNAIDHGLETPDERRAAGKPARGQIRLSARHAEGGVVLTLHDDGRGLSRAALLAKAESRGLIEPGAGAQMADARVWELIFAPGLSTSPITTDLSGRGVGMDVVRRSVVDDLCGDLRIDNEPGRGLTIELRVPLSLALTRVLLFRLGEQDLGLAARQVVALVRIGADEIHHVAHHPAISRHGSFVPLLSLAALLRLPGADDGDGTSLEERAAAGEGLLAVIVGAGGSQLALVVDRLLDERDMVIKSLPEHLSNTCSLVGGIVVAGDDRLASILQAPGLLALARRAGMPDLAGAAPTPTAGSTPTQRHILVVEDSLNTREIERELLEAAGYRVSLAEDGRAGLEFADQTEFDAVLTDVEMPRMTGFELTRRLREHPRYRTRPIIILTSLRNEADRQRGIEAGADAYMVKGDFEQSGLIATLAHLLP